MRRLTAVMFVAVVAVALPAVATAKKKHATDCRMHGAATVLATNEARIFSREARGLINVYGCRNKTGKRYLLSSAEADPGGAGDETTKEQINGPFVAYALNSFDDSQRYNPDFKGFANTVEVLDLRDGKRRSASAVTTGPGSATSLVLTGSGSIAWIGSGASIEVWQMPAAGAKALLDSGPVIGLDSLALGGKTLYWTNGPIARSAILG